MQSTLGTILLISVERIAATALGALAGALLATYFTGNLVIFATAVFVLGLLCAAFRMEKTAYRYASVTLAIIVSFRVQTPPGSSRFTASSKFPLESWSLWRSPLSGRSINPDP